jgi:hypothetical protein
MKNEQFESWLYYSCKKACDGKIDVVIAYDGDNVIIGDENFIKTYYPNAEIVEFNN